MAQSPIHSTGRGGAGNIGSDPDATYVDGDIVREGVAGEPENPGRDYSAGRGGAGNIIPPARTGASARNASASHDTLPPPAGQQPQQPQHDFVPETATRTSRSSDYHTGRGGEGNVHRDMYGGHSSPQKEHRGSGKVEELVEKAKHAIGLNQGHPKKAEQEGSK